MATFNYTPTNLSLPEMPKLTGSSTPMPVQNISNTFAKNILDTLGKNIKPVQSYSQTGNINAALAPTQELGRQFVQQALLPEFQRNIFNPFIRRTANQAAGSNLSLMGNGKNFIDARTREVTQPFYDQAQNVQDTFNAAAYDDVNQLLKDFYGSQFNF